MLEIEQKYVHPDLAQLENDLRRLGATPGEVHQETDHYLNAPDRDFARTDEAFRLRRIGPRNYLTYKGPKQGGPVKKRTELEIPLLDGPEAATQFLQLLHYLHYRPTLVVRKQRRYFHWTIDGFPLTICLDEVEDLGTFAEVEILAPPEREQDAELVIQKAARDLGLTDVEPKSYLQLRLEQSAEATS